MAINKLLSVLIILYLCLFPFGQLGRIELPKFTIHLTDLIVGITSGVWFLQTILRRKVILPLFGFLFISFFSIATFSLLLNYNNQDILRGTLYLLRLGAYIVFYYAISNWIKVTPFAKKLLTRRLFMVGLYTTIFAILQYILLPDTRTLVNFGWDDHYFRLIGTFLDPGFLGIILVLFCFLSIQVFEQKKNRLYFIPIILGVFSLSFTFSRASYLAFFVGLIFLNIIKPKFLITFIALLIFGISLYFSPKPGGEGVNLSRTSTITSRVDGYKIALEKGLKMPVFGYGFNLLVDEKCKEKNICGHASFGTDSSLLFIFLTTGVLGLTCYLYLFFKLLKFSWNGRKTILGGTLFVSLIATFTHSTFSNSLFYPWVLGWILVLLSLVENNTKMKEDIKDYK